MGTQFEVRWERELPASPEVVWDAFTVHSAGWLWHIEFEPKVGGAERGLTPGGGTVTVWDPARRFTTRSLADGDGFNELGYVLEPRGRGTQVSYLHRGVLADDEYDVQLDACRQHTAFYSHSMSEYAQHFAGREPVYVEVDAPEASTKGGFAVVRRALGLAPDAAVGDPVRLAPDGIPPIDATIDYLTPAFLGVRTADALIRVYGRDLWGWPVGVAMHLFADDADGPATTKTWRTWLDGLFTVDEEA